MHRSVQSRSRESRTIRHHCSGLETWPHGWPFLGYDFVLRKVPEEVPDSGSIDDEGAGFDTVTSSLPRVRLIWKSEEDTHTGATAGFVNLETSKVFHFTFGNMEFRGTSYNTSGWRGELGPSRRVTGSVALCFQNDVKIAQTISGVLLTRYTTACSCFFCRMFCFSIGGSGFSNLR